MERGAELNQEKQIKIRNNQAKSVALTKIEDLKRNVTAA